MTKRHSTQCAALYLRMSITDQDKSIAAQRNELKKLAKRRNYRIVAEYRDEGISGDDTEKRLGFLKMGEDAVSGSFSVILC